MTQASEQIAKQYANAAVNKKNWGDIAYNALVEGLSGDGVSDDTAKLQALINKAIDADRRTILFPHGQYYVTALTNTDQVDFVGDNSSFVGGYTGTILQLGASGVSQSVFDALKDDYAKEVGAVFNVKGYGVKGDDVTDDTVAINGLIDSVTKGNIFFPPGTYLISKQGTRLLTFSGVQRGYGLLLLNKSNITLEFAPGAIIKMAVGDATVFNGIWVEGCDNVDILNPEFTGTGTTSTLMLEEGTGITITTSTRVTVDKPSSTNLRGCARAYNSSNITIKNGFSTVYANEHSTGHFALYSSTDSVIDHCVSYGATLDGDMFVYGGSSINCTIQNSRSHAYVYGDTSKTIFYNQGQGIQIDSGGRDCKILDCYAYGYYYGFDAKNASEGTTISGCTAEKCKVGISARKGEGAASPTNVLLISGNTIIPNGGNGNTVPLTGTLAGPFAIAVFDVYGGARIKGNLMYNSRDLSAFSNFIGVIIGISDSGVADGQQGGFMISDNEFAFSNRLNPTFGSNQTQAIYITSQYLVSRVTIEGNDFDLPSEGITTNCIEAYNVKALKISDNNFSDYVTTGKPLMKVQNCTKVQITDNIAGGNWGIVEGYATIGIVFSNNISAESLNPTPTPSVYFSNCQWINVCGNTQYPYFGLNLDSFYYKDDTGSDWVNMQNNLLNLVNKGPTDYFSSVATNKSFTNNLVS